MAGLTLPWEQVRAEAAESRSLASQAPAHFMFDSKFISLLPEVTAYAGDSFTPARPILEAAVDLMGRIRREFAYRKNATAVTTTVAEAFARRQGVCQDFAQVMIAGLRGLGLPAAYVSGYIRTIPPPGKPKLAGADASHAWVSIWCGPQFGWIDLDPTNDMLISDDHIIVAIGRDYSDVSPVDGVFVGSGSHDLAVSVDVDPISD
jgi:transglutaminase-like putative cysteine protease